MQGNPLIALTYAFCITFIAYCPAVLAIVAVHPRQQLEMESGWMGEKH